MPAVLTAPIREGVKSISWPPGEKRRPKLSRQTRLGESETLLPTKLTGLKDLTGHGHVIESYTFHGDIISRRQWERFPHLLRLLAPL